MRTMRKTVSFRGFAVVGVKEEVGPHERGDLWYTKKDITVNQNKKKKDSLSQTEHGTRSTSSIRRRNYVKNVLALQEEHRDNRVDDATGLQRFASAMSKPDEKVAQQRAKEDSIDAFEVLAPDAEVALYLRAKNAEEFSKPTRKAVVMVKRKSPAKIMMASSMQRAPPVTA